MLACRAVSNSAPRSLLAAERRSVVARELVERNRRLPRYLGDDIRHLGSKRFHHVLKYFQQRVGRPIRHAGAEQALLELFRRNIDVANRFTERRGKFLGYFAVGERFRSGDRVSLSLVTTLGESLERNGRNVAHIDVSHARVAKRRVECTLASDRSGGAEQILHEYAGAQVRPGEAGRFEVILGFCMPADDARRGLGIIGPERGEFHDVLHAGALRGVNERPLLLDLIGVVRRQQQRAINGLESLFERCWFIEVADCDMHTFPAKRRRLRHVTHERFREDAEACQLQHDFFAGRAGGA
jgi:hypothetical protein